MYETKIEHFYRDIKDNISEKFDTSNFQETFDIPRMNKKVPGMFEDECGGKLISEFCGWRAKLYSYKMCEDGIEVKRCKGIKKNVVSKSIQFNDHKRCLFCGKGRTAKNDCYS